MAGFNISSFFNNSGNNGIGSFNFSDFALIKSGSYKKMMKTYYSPSKETTKTSKSDTDRKEKIEKSAGTFENTALSKMRTEASELKKAAESFDKDELFKQDNGEYDMDKISSNLKNFAKEYNDVLEQSRKAGSREVAQQTGFMTGLSKTMSEALSKVGVTFDSNGKMSVDEETLKKADAKSVKTLFSGSYSYASQIAQKAGAINSAALRSSSIYSSNGKMSGSVSGMFDSWT